jgi:two-component system cell cycle sensor histidine kinase/response regulator CckA
MNRSNRERPTIDQTRLEQFERTFSKTIIDVFPGCFTVFDANGRLVWWNNYYRDVIIGIPESELSGYAVMRGVHPDDRAVVSEKIFKILTNGVEDILEAKILLHGGPEYQWRMISCSRIMMEGEPFIVAFGLDITGRKQFEALTVFRMLLLDMPQTSSIEDLLKATLDEAERITESQVGFCHFDGDDQATLSMQVLSSKLLKKIGSLSEKSYHPSFVHPDLWRDATSHQRPVISNNISAIGHHLTDMPEGHPRIQRALVVPISRGGKVEIIVGVGEKSYDYDEEDAKLIGTLVDFAWDIVARKRAELSAQKIQEVLLQAQKMELVGQLAGGIARDFNNMLEVILGNVEMALKQNILEPRLQKNLVNILEAVEHSAELTSQLLAFSRKQVVMPIVLDLNVIVERMLAMQRRLIGDQITLVWIPESCRTPVKIDPEQIDLILGNLCVNARDAISGNGQITIETRIISVNKSDCAAGHICKHPGDYVKLIVTDTGCGIAKKNLPHIFEPFFTTKKNDQGTGMGLSTVYGIIKQNSAFIDCQSESGKGTVFKIYFPKHSGYADPDRQEVPAPPENHGKETVLIVEDEPDILNLCKLILERSGYAVLTSKTPEDALRIATNYENKIHLLLTDVIMPKMNGCELSKQLLESNPDIKTLYMTGYKTDIMTRQGVVDDGVKFISKPFSICTLTKKVCDLLEGVDL